MKELALAGVEDMEAANRYLRDRYLPTFNAVPEGVLFGSTGAHKELRRRLVENNRVEAVLPLPGSVFNPYSGVKTSLLVFRKGGTTERVMFLHAENDGFKLDANHDTPIDEDALPGLIKAFRDRDARWVAWYERNQSENWWFAEIDAVRAADFNLRANRHRPLNRAKVEHGDPLETLENCEALRGKSSARSTDWMRRCGEPRGNEYLCHGSVFPQLEYSRTWI